MNRPLRLVGRISAHGATLSVGCLGFADSNLAVGQEHVGRDRQIERRGPLPDAARRYRIASRGRGRTSRRSRPDGRAGCSRDGCRCRSRTSHWSWPALTRASSVCGSGRLLVSTARASSISFWVRWLMKIGLLRQNTLTICPAAIGAEIDLHRRAGRDRGGVRVHLRDERHQGRRRADRGDGTGRDIEKIATRRLGRRHRCHVCDPFLIPSIHPHAHRPRLPCTPEKRRSPGSGGRTCRFPPRGREAKRHDPAAFYWHP